VFSVSTTIADGVVWGGCFYGWRFHVYPFSIPVVVEVYFVIPVLAHSNIPLCLYNSGYIEVWFQLWMSLSHARKAAAYGCNLASVVQSDNFTDINQEGKVYGLQKSCIALTRNTIYDIYYIMPNSFALRLPPPKRRYHLRGKASINMT
jgi:hypothetical protein